MSALREWAATLGGQARAAEAVNALGKWKTATQVGLYLIDEHADAVLTALDAVCHA